MNWWDENKFFEKLNIFTWIAFLVFCLFLLSFTSKAEEPYFPMLQNANNAFPEVVKSAIDSRFDNENNFIFFYTNDINNDGWTRGWVGVIAKNNLESPFFYGEIQNNGYTWNAYSLNNITISCYKVNANRSTGQLGVTYLGNNQAVFNNMLSSNYTTTTDFISNFRIYTSNSENAEIILKYGPDPVGPFDVGIAIIPQEPILPDFDNLTPPSKVPPTYTPSDYNWTTPPTFDGSSVENALGSIQNIIGWLANNLKEEFKNLTDNLEGFFKYIGETIQYYAGIIIDTLNNFITNFYENMKSLVQPIFEKIDYLTQPLESDVIWDNISGTSIITNFNSISGAVSSFKDSFNILSEPSEYKIPIHLENLPSSMFGTLTVQYIDLSVINPVKSIIRTFVWALMTYALVITIFDSIANYINGGGDES